MGFMIYLFELFERRMGINLRGGYARMPQEILDTLEPGPMIEHRCSKRMTQHVWGAFLQGRHLRQIFPDDTIHLAGGDAFPLGT